MILYYIFVLSLPFVSHPLFAIELGGLTVEKLVGAAAVVYAILHLMARKTKPAFLDNWPARAFLAYFLVCLFSHLVLGRGGPAGMDFAFLPFNFLLILFMTVSVVDTVARLRWSLLTAIASIAWGSLYMLREWQGGMRVYGYGYRPGYVVGDPNYFAASALLCLPLAVYFGRSMPERWIRWGCWVSAGLAFAGILVSGSRGGLIGLAVVAALMVWHSQRRLRTLFLVAVAGAALMLSPASPLERLLHPGSSGQGSTEARRVLWRAAWRMFSDHPLTGVGFGNFRAFAPKYVEKDIGHDFIVHNEYLEELAEMGLPGVLAYCGMYAAAFATLSRARGLAQRLKSRLLYDAALGIQIGIAGFGVSVVFITANFLRLFWFMAFISTCLPALLSGAAYRLRTSASPAGRPCPDSRAPLTVHRSGGGATLPV